MAREQRIRAFLFYISLFIFLIGLPFILSFALGYKFNPRTFKFAKAGLIVLKTQPQGADIYLDGKLLNEKTPHTINELLPGKYSLRLELERHYPWVGDVNVNAGKVARLEKVILFPLRPNIKQLNKDEISSFWVDEAGGRVYYLNQQDSIIYHSDLEGGNFRMLGVFPEIEPPPQKFKTSLDREKLLAFNSRKIAIAYLDTQNGELTIGQSFVLTCPNRKIIDVFWHSDSYHLIVVTDRDIEALEADPQSTPVSLANLNKRNSAPFYDAAKDALYFIDYQKAADGKFYENVYKLDLSAKFYPFHDLIKPKPNE